MDTTIQQISLFAMSAANVHIFWDMLLAFFHNSFAITTKSLARYFNEYSLRQFSRFLSQDFDGYLIRTRVFEYHFFDKNKKYLAVIDETVEGKSGKRSFGVGRFYSSLD